MRFKASVPFTMGIFAIIWLLISCNSTSTFNMPSLINQWQEIEQGNQLAGSNFSRLYIKEDSTFQLQYIEWNDVVDPLDHCIFTTQFMKGRCFTLKDEVHFVGCFTDSMYTNCLPGCAGDLQFTRTYNYFLVLDRLILGNNQAALRHLEVIQ